MDDIAPPMAPKVPKVENTEEKTKKEEKKGFLTKIFAKKELSQKSTDVDTEISKLRSDLGIIGEKKPSIREQFEEQVQQEYVEDEEFVPAPPPETLEKQTEHISQELIKGHIEEFSKDSSIIDKKDTEILDKPLESFNVDDLEEKLDTIGETIPLPSTQFFLSAGKEANTLSDLQTVIAAMKPAEFKKNSDQGNFSTWIKDKLFNADLANDVSQLTQQKRVLELLDAELGTLPQKKNTAEKKAVVIHKDVELHFDTLTKEHRKAMEKLEKVVLSRKSDELNKRQLTTHFKLENNKLVESLKDLVRSVELIDEAEYKKVVANKDDFLEWVKVLVEKSKGPQTLNAEKLQSALAEQVKVHAQEIELKIARLRQELKDEEAMLKKREEAILENELQLHDKENYIADQEESLLNRKQQFREEIVSHNQDSGVHRKEQMTFMQEYEKKLKELTITIEKEKKNRERAEKKILDQKEQLTQKEKDLRKQELEIPQKVREQAIGVVKEREELKAKKDELNLRERALEEKEEDIQKKKDELEQEIGVREEQIQQSIDKLLALDEDAKTQRLRAEQLKDELDNQGFKKYLDARLKEIRSGKPFDHAEPKKEARKLYGDLYQKIDECNDAIEKKDFDTAKAYYKELKDMFEHQHISDDKKDLLYDAIRELYTNLQLAMLEE